MPVTSVHRQVQTSGHGDIVDITKDVRDAVSQNSLTSGIATIFITGSTAGLTTIEYEPGLLQDLSAAFERLYPSDLEYRHHERWGDDNGHSHVRASMLGPSLAVPFVNGELTLGTWQQIVLVDFDTRSREREFVMQLIS